MIVMSLTKKITHCALISSVAIIFGYIEALFPFPTPVPGIKLGLGNIAVLVCLYIMGAKPAFFVMIIKVFVTAMLFSSPSVIIYSLSGGLLSYFAMLLMKRLSFNIVSVSIGGGILHNIGQLTAAAVMLKSINMLYYAAVLIPAGAVAAVVTGILARIIIPRVKKIAKK